MWVEEKSLLKQAENVKTGKDGGSSAMVNPLESLVGMRHEAFRRIYKQMHGIISTRCILTHNNPHFTQYITQHTQV